MNKFYSFAIAAMALMCSVTAQAGDKFVVDGLQYEIMDDGSGVQVTKSTESSGYAGDITVPATVKNGNVTYKVVAVGKDAFRRCASIKSVTLPNTVQIIDGYAFNASSVEKVVLGEGVERIMDGAFAVVRSLAELSEIPASCLYIEDGAFSMTDKLTAFKVNADNPAYKSIDGALYTKSGKTLLAVPFGMDPSGFVVPEGTDSIASNVFNTFKTLEKITFSSTLKYIGLSAFTACNVMENTNDFPETLEVIGGSAFSSCYALKNLTVGPNVTTIGGYAFNGAVTPTEVHVGSKTSMGFNAFASNRSVIAKITIDAPEAANAKIPEFCFQYAQIEEIIIPEGYTAIDSRAFENNSKLKTIDLPATLATIGNMAFGNDKPEVIVSRGTVPPAFKYYTSYADQLIAPDCMATVKVYVPDAAVETYKADAMWSKFTNILPLSQYSGVQDVVADDAVKTVATESYYDLSGREVAPAAEKKGLYIVRTTYTDGSVKTAKKVF